MIDVRMGRGEVSWKLTTFCKTQKDPMLCEANLILPLWNSLENLEKTIKTFQKDESYLNILTTEKQSEYF